MQPSLSQALLALRSTDASQKDAGARALIEHVRLMSRRARIQPRDHDELVSCIVLKIHERNPLEAILERTPGLTNDPMGLEKVCVAYVSTMIYNLVVSDARRARREKVAPDAGVDVAVDRDADLQSMAGELAGHAEKILDGVFAELVARKPARRVALEQAWTQLRALAARSTTMKELLAAEGAPPGDVRTTRSRLYKRHQRLRDQLLGLIESLPAEKLSKVEAALATFAVEAILHRTHEQSHG